MTVSMLFVLTSIAVLTSCARQIPNRVTAEEYELGRRRTLRSVRLTLAPSVNVVERATSGAENMAENGVFRT
jgi:hypothetical protein